MTRYDDFHVQSQCIVGCTHHKDTINCNTVWWEGTYVPMRMSPAEIPWGRISDLFTAPTLNPAKSYSPFLYMPDKWRKENGWDIKSRYKRCSEMYQCNGRESLLRTRQQAWDRMGKSSFVRNSMGQHNVVRYNAMRLNTIQISAIQCNTDAIYYNAMQYYTIETQCSTKQHKEIECRHNTTQHSTATIRSMACNAR